MIEQQIKPWKVFDTKLLGAMATIPREQFVPEEHRNISYADTAIPLGHNQVMLAPRELARMIQAMELTGSEKILEIGCGSGYSSAILSKLAAKVYSVDIIAEFVKNAEKNIKKMAFDNVIVEEIDASEGWLAHAPYDVILITSGLATLADSFKRNLSSKGRIIAILGEQGAQSVNLCRLNDKEEWECESLFPTEAPTLINSEKPNQFVF